MIEQTIMNIQDQLMNQVAHHEVQQDSWLHEKIRVAAREEFLRLGFPTVKHEEWKFTNVTPFFKEEMAVDNFTKSDYLDPLSIHDLLNAHLEDIQAQMKGEAKGAYRLILMNGNIVRDLSYLPDNADFSIQYLSELTNDQRHNLKIGELARYKDNHFTALNTALVEDGLFINVANGYVVDKPLHIVHILDRNQSTFYNSRAFIYLGRNAQLELVETYLKQDDKARKVIVNAVYEFQLEEQAICDHYDIQKTNDDFYQIKRTEVSQSLHSNYSNYTFNLPGGAFFRNNLAIHIEDKDTECHLYGLYLTDKSQLVDNHTEVHHKSPNCESNQLYKGVLLDESKAVFNGKIYVYEDAQKTNAFQKSNNILLSDKATINAKPQLEIFADDVKCSHGSTIGQLDNQALFYLKSRGIGEATAKKMMVNAFAFDVAQKVKNPTLRHYLEEQITLAIN